LTIIPDIIKEDEEYAFVFIAIKKIRIAAKIPKKIEKRGVAFNKIIDVFLAKIGLSLTKFNEDEKKEERNIAKEQPKEAPEDMPSVYGSAKGFFNIICITRPQTERTAPIMKADINEGILMLFITIKMVGSIIKFKFLSLNIPINM